ncbi:aconitate hydratase AcnA [Magnetospirillum aberrantis]|uniref:Aconitate hydratase n=1 Tax=Magnetospirillum aberrantis SpK TaxID=908842 RepID=A0A7C9QSM9_9PROT|nr:aconitate hydratase AcnA [Magnetospirillum aberrantis]NFV79504.1 aconitate hydratase AcnA [Magnetospirillum aberrantis SpK]
MSTLGQDTLKTRRTLTVGDKAYAYYSLKAAEAAVGDVSCLPFSLKVLLENLLRFEDGRSVTADDIRAVAAWTTDRGRAGHEIAFRPARVLMQDFTGVPAVVDLAAMRDAMAALGGDPARINPQVPVDLVIDHSVMVDSWGGPDSLARNMELEFARNGERYAFLRWGQGAFDNFRVVPPGTGICHQVNCEYLAQVAWSADGLVYPDTLVGTDSHTTMVGGMAVLGWGVGGIEAEAAMLGQPLSMLIPEVVGFRLSGSLREGVTATDLVLTVTEMLRAKGVVGKFVEFFGPGLSSMALPDRLTIGNMAPEYGATCGFFPIDAETLRFLAFTGRDPHRVALVEAYARAQGLWRDETTPDPLFTETLELELGTVEPSLSGPKRPQDRVALSAAKAGFDTFVPAAEQSPRVPLSNGRGDLGHGDVVIAAITSCTNTSNPSVMLAAGLVAQKAVARGLRVKPWVKTSLAPGSQVVPDYLAAAGLQESLDSLGFTVAGFGCTTCIGNSGPLDPAIAEAIDGNNLVVAAVLSGNRNFEGRISPHVKANYLASPPLVVAYALAGSMRLDLSRDPLGIGADGQPVHLHDIWPSTAEIQAAMERALSPDSYRRRYADVFKGPALWQQVPVTTGQTYDWPARSTYIHHPPYFTDMAPLPPQGFADIQGARALAILGDSITTDHISPAGSIKPSSPAGTWLVAHGVAPADFNSYGSRRGHDAVMTRGTLANVRIRNEIAPGHEGGVTRLNGAGEVLSIFDAAMAYQAQGTPLVVVAGKEYGTGSSRDWAAKGTYLLGVKAVVAESFERIHRSNLVGMGVLPLQFPAGTDRKILGLDGTETFSVRGLSEGLKPRQTLTLEITHADGRRHQVPVLCRIDTVDEVEYFRHGGILHYVLRSLAG